MKLNKRKKTNNKHQNKVFRDAVAKIEHDLGIPPLADSKVEALHREVSKKGFDYHDIIQIGKDMFR